MTVCRENELSWSCKLLLPLEQEDLPPLAKPWRKDEWEGVTRLARQMGIEAEPLAPIRVFGVRTKHQ